MDKLSINFRAEDLKAARCATANPHRSGLPEFVMCPASKSVPQPPKAKPRGAPLSRAPS